jgi:hypothetical protein
MTQPVHPQVTLTANTLLAYAGVSYGPGMQFSAPTNDADVLIKSGVAQLAPTKLVPAKPA